MNTNKLFNDDERIISTPTSVRKFYFLEYFYILLKSIDTHSEYNAVLAEFVLLKNKYSLGESKYKKLTSEKVEVTKKQMVKFEYTFKQVLSESTDYGLVERNNQHKNPTDEYHLSDMYLTQNGTNALREYDINGKLAFNQLMLKKMEERSHAFYQLLKLCYTDSISKNGLLIFPIYSGLKLGFDKRLFNTNQQVFEYSTALRKKLEEDIRMYTKKTGVSLIDEEKYFLKKLQADNFIHGDDNQEFDSRKYNALLSRFRKYWLNYFLKNIYGYEYSFDTFNIWVERAKQVGILHTTEFFPEFSGRIIYPTAVITQNTFNEDFTHVFKYTTGESLYIHDPNWNSFQTSFIQTLQYEYYTLQSSKKTHFINLLDLYVFKLKCTTSA